MDNDKYEGTACHVRDIALSGAMFRRRLTESRSVTVEDRLESGVVEDLHKLGVKVSMTSGYDYHMGSYSVIARESAGDSYTAVANPRRCAVADGVPF